MYVHVGDVLVFFILLHVSKYICVCMRACEIPHHQNQNHVNSLPSNG
jgi:hypothetical protein